jgi:hypothetical protein
MEVSDYRLRSGFFISGGRAPRYPLDRKLEAPREQGVKPPIMQLVRPGIKRLGHEANYILTSI